MRRLLGAVAVAVSLAVSSAVTSAVPGAAVAVSGAAPVNVGLAISATSSGSRYPFFATFDLRTGRSDLPGTISIWEQRLGAATWTLVKTVSPDYDIRVGIPMTAPAQYRAEYSGGTSPDGTVYAPATSASVSFVLVRTILLGTTKGMTLHGRVLPPIPGGVVHVRIRYPNGTHGARVVHLRGGTRFRIRINAPCTSRAHFIAAGAPGILPGATKMTAVRLTWPAGHVPAAWNLCAATLNGYPTPPLHWQSDSH